MLGPRNACGICDWPPPTSGPRFCVQSAGQSHPGGRCLAANGMSQVFTALQRAIQRLSAAACPCPIHRHDRAGLGSANTWSDGPKKRLGSSVGQRRTSGCQLHRPKGAWMLAWRRHPASAAERKAPYLAKSRLVLRLQISTYRGDGVRRKPPLGLMTPTITLLEWVRS
jgi:hypothetical protein